jgi:hypothetical protein
MLSMQGQVAAKLIATAREIVVFPVPGSPPNTISMRAAKPNDITCDHANIYNGERLVARSTSAFLLRAYETGRSAFGPIETFDRRLPTLASGTKGKHGAMSVP